jgi:hypothetical protein
MGFFSKLAFWKKKDEFESLGLGEKGASLGPDLSSSDLGLSTASGLEGGYGLPTQPTQQPTPPQPSFQQQPSYQQFQQPSPQQPQGFTAEKDLEIISSKLDALRAALDSINQRLANLEAIARGEQEQSKGRYRY